MAMQPAFTLNKQCESWRITYHRPPDDIDNDKRTLLDPEQAQGAIDTREQPKVALGRRISAPHALVHILPVLITIGIVQLSFRQVYWADEPLFDPRWPDVLQFPAKVHEILIVGSLIFRRMLIGPDGVPLGLVVGAFQIGSAEYLISKSYVKPLRHSFYHRHYKSLFVAVALGSAIVYSFLVGPASAGALIPSLGWWRMSRLFNHSLPLVSYIQCTPSELRPMKLDSSNVYHTCLDGDNWESQGCPGEGYNQLSNWQWTRFDEGWDYTITSGRHNSPTMINTFSRRSRRELVTRLVTCNNMSSSAALTATLSSSVLALTDSFWHWVGDDSAFVARDHPIQPRLVTSRDTPVYIPLVQVQCNPIDYAVANQSLFDGKDSITFDTSNIINQSSTSTADVHSGNGWIVPNELLNFTQPSDDFGQTSVKWIDTSKLRGPQGESLNASLTVAVTVPHIFYNDSKALQGAIISACVINARWVSTDVRFDPKTEDIVGTRFTDWLAPADLSTNGTNDKSNNALSGWNISDPISLSADWADALNSEAPPSNEKYRDSTIVEHLLLQFMATIKVNNSDGGVDGNDGTKKEMKLFNFGKLDQPSENYSFEAANIAVTLSAVVADWLSRSTFGNVSLTTWISEPENGKVRTVEYLPGQETPEQSIRSVTDFDSQTHVVFEAQRHGYAYSMKSGTTWFSVIILLIHVLLVLVHFSYSAVFFFWQKKNGWVSSAWGSIGELVALAVTSPPADELRNSGAGISRSRTWMTRLRLREAASEPDRVELVVGIRGGTVIPGAHRLKTSKEYV
ncbi:hypothetical protein F4808DRAFT_469413 [Astrocystis sublimbata]|nr:hypothetical protein F4808DRAFT_469413 [Astrocystis sublimbata]